MNSLKVIFFGSTDDSVIVARALHRISLANYLPELNAVVTQPPRPVGREQIVTPTPVECWARKEHIAILSFPNIPKKPWLFEDEETVIDALEPIKAHLVVSASFGQKIPSKIFRQAQYGGLNIHPSLLPRWRGADPVPWAIANGDHQIGASVITLEEKFDQGRIIAQQKVPIQDSDKSDPLRTKLFSLGAKLLITSLPDYLSGKNEGKPQDPKKSTYARRLTREDGFETWEKIKEALATGNDAGRVERKFRAFYPWPGLWTKMTIDGCEKRVKILDLALRDQKLIIRTVQLEGKNPVDFEQFVKAYHLNPDSK